MHARVVRFTDVTQEQVDSVLRRIDASDGPPPGVKAAGLQVLYDEDQGTAVVVQLFDSAGDMEAAEEAFDSMDPSETPGTRASIDRCEVKLDLKI
jgi:hypothetical protein